jgi:hypothetical protein
MQAAAARDNWGIVAKLQEVMKSEVVSLSKNRGGVSGAG